MVFVEVIDAFNAVFAFIASLLTVAAYLPVGLLWAVADVVTVEIGYLFAWYNAIVLLGDAIAYPFAVIWNALAQFNSYWGWVLFSMLMIAVAFRLHYFIKHVSVFGVSL